MGTFINERAVGARSIICILSALLVFFGACANADDLVLRDPVRKRDIPVRIYRPAQKPGVRYPVVIFSHGNGSSKNGYRYFGEYIAAHGFISIQPTHLGSDASQLHAGMANSNLRTMRRVSNDPGNWSDRIDDIKLILDSLTTIAPDADAKHIALAGHAYGAMTVMMMAGALTKWPDGTSSKPEKRIKAFIAISPQGEGKQFPHNAWKRIRKPMLVVTGSEDHGIARHPISWRVDVYKNLPPGKKHLLFINGATHMSFADAPRPGFADDPGEMRRTHEYVQKAGLAFLEAYLRGDKTALNYLDSNAVSEESGGAVRIERK